MQNPLISIIVPVYNARRYIDQCVKSVLSQSFRDLELILVNDGSTDESLEKCRAWESDPRVTVISTENRGVSHARNTGLEKASGKWILFLDSDDYLLDDALEKLMERVLPDTREVIAAYAGDGSGDVKILCGSVEADHVRRMTLDPVNNHLLPDFYEMKPLSLTACWAKLFLNDVIRENGIRFHEELRLSEDTLFHLAYLRCIDHALVTNLPVMYYRQNTSSVTKVFNEKHLSNRIRFFNILEEEKDPDAAAHILPLLFFDICKIQRYAAGEDRKRLEREVIRYLSEHGELLRSVGNRSLSCGRWQKAAYKAAAKCFERGAYRAGFAVLRLYSAVTQGEISKITTNQSKTEN